ncbi:MFS general substrate transporter [Coniochaeta ligniaria NRRL 30616]|uniref:MFS general substrate transporter n=1 Tax=Coniochaeta ligniaria NRRL 30616 TaxID=1408157 RepID=A0A1J7J4Y4_9PEZI|nr:MFS general substrate transporter [Coniochaeta ligniaria NRRL 30616]
MGLWVLKPKTNEKVPGTVHVERDTEQLRSLTANLKHSTGRDVDIVLVPQPSDSSPGRKVFHSILLSFGTGLASGTCYFLNPSATAISKQIGTTVTQLSRTVSFLILCMGIASILTTPLARIYGKRPIFLGLNLLGIIGYSILLSKPHDIRYIYAGRALWGATQNALEYLVSSSVGDLFFVHQRGAFRYAVIFISVYIVALFFLAPETTYNRATKYDTNILEVLADELDQRSASTDAASGEGEKLTSRINVSEPNESRERPKTYIQSLKIYNGRFSNESYLRGAAYSYGCSVAFSGTLSVYLSQIFTAPPYNFSTSAVGLTVLSPVVANVIGNFIPGPVADWLVTFMARKNGGVYEPEFRNILSIPALITGIIGYWGFGLAIHARLHWFVPVFFFGVAAFSGSILSLISNTYLLDCHRKYAQDAYAAVTLIKAVMTFAIAFFVNDWLAKSGPIQVFFVIGTIHIIGCIYGLVLYVWGKRIRLAVHKNEFIQNALRFCGNDDQRDAIAA